MLILDDKTFSSLICDVSFQLKLVASIRSHNLSTGYDLWYDYDVQKLVSKQICKIYNILISLTTIRH